MKLFSAITLATILTGLTGSLAVSATGVPGVDDPLDVVKSLYLAASYAEALSALDKLPDGADLAAADKYRALCFLGLDRRSDAERALESLVMRQPQYSMDQLESPKLVAMFKSVRARKLPEVAKDMFASAKSAYEKGDMKAAAAQFTTLLAILNGPDVGSNLSDLKMLADGFSTLAQKQLPPPAPPRVAENQAAIGRPSASSVPEVPAQIFTIGDEDVVPPVPVIQNIPRWEATNAMFQGRTYTGSIEVVIDETGSVVGASIRDKINTIYDPLIVAAAAKWKYRPALRNGQPVKYRKVIPVTLKPIGRTEN
jgi:protein TonB